MSVIPVILGATGTGKTVIADLLCEKINGEIISADSRQIYKYLNIGTNKSVTKSPQHLIDIINPDETFSAGDFFELASAKFQEIKLRNKKPVVVGGTGLYIKTLLDGGLARLPGANWYLRKKFSSYTPEQLYQKLLKVDPLSAQRNRGNPHRLIRSLEVYYLTGVPMSVLHERHKIDDRTQKKKEKYICIGLLCDKSILYKQIFERTKWMVENGIVEETKRVLSIGYPRTSPAFKSIGYRYVFDLIDGKISKQELVEKIFTDTKKYIKRQLTWFKKYPSNINWIDKTNIKEDQVLERISDILNTQL